jgi:hypothetical protein
VGQRLEQRVVALTAAVMGIEEGDLMTKEQKLSIVAGVLLLVANFVLDRARCAD